MHPSMTRLAKSQCSSYPINDLAARKTWNHVAFAPKGALPSLKRRGHCKANMMTDLDELLDDLFHGAAIAAYVEEAALAGKSPCLEKTRQRAYRYFEEELAKKHRAR